MMNATTRETKYARASTFSVLKGFISTKKPACASKDLGAISIVLGVNDWTQEEDVAVLISLSLTGFTNVRNMQISGEKVSNLGRDPLNRESNFMAFSCLIMLSV